MRSQPRLRAQLVALLALGGVQGFIGWYMVQSGLVERVSVSQYRLALHLTLAIVIFGALVWIVLDLAPRRAQRIRLDTVSAWQRRLGVALVGLVFVQIVLGAFVAGLKAGFTYNTWPLMDGKLVPDGLLSMSPWYLNPFENITMVQFNHRVMAYVLVVAGGVARVGAGAHGGRRACRAVGAGAAGGVAGAGGAGDLDAGRGGAAVARHRPPDRGGRGVR